MTTLWINSILSATINFTRKLLSAYVRQALGASFHPCACGSVIGRERVDMVAAFIAPRIDRYVELQRGFAGIREHVVRWKLDIFSLVDTGSLTIFNAD